MGSTPSTTPITMKINQEENKNGPDHKYQINQHLLYEREFPGATYVSAHLQRLQNGLFSHNNLHNKDTMHVTFAAITFTLHPSVSISHRFTSANIIITARSEDGEPIRFLRFAPHLAYGRISSSSLKWNFQLGATCGITKGPVNLALNPSVSYEKDTVVGTMMKIQGSTRGTEVESHEHLVNIGKKKYPDTKLFWTMEENTQQQTGLPREFTFVFLMERLAPTPPSCGKQSTTAGENANTHGLNLLEHPIRSNTPPLIAKKPEDQKSPKLPLTGQASTKMLTNGEPTPPEWTDENDPISYDLEGTYLPHKKPIPKKPKESSFERGIEEFKDEVKAITSPFRSENVDDYIYTDNTFPNIKLADHDYSAVFTPIRFNICVEPQISGIVVGVSFEKSEETSIVAGEVGQKFPTDFDMPANVKGNAEKEEIIDGLYNFAKLPGSFEDLIELPGNAITSLEPNLPDPH